MIEFDSNKTIGRNFPLSKQMAFIPEVDLDSGATLTVQTSDGRQALVLSSTSTLTKKSASTFITSGKYDLVLAGQTTFPFKLSIKGQ